MLPPVPSGWQDKNSDRLLEMQVAIRLWIDDGYGQRDLSHAEISDLECLPVGEHP